MKKQLKKIATLTLTLFSFAAFSQEKIQPCNTFAAMDEAFAQDPQLKKNYEAAQEQLRLEQIEFEKNAQARQTTAVQYTIPVVFHVLYECNGVNIADSTIVQALESINKDYARTNFDTSQVATPFKNSYINSDIKMMLAHKDPQGNCTNGIVRHLDSRTHWSQTSANGGLPSNAAYWAHTWDPRKYLNVYLVAEIIPQGTVTGGGIIVGYTFRPGTWGANDPHDAIVYNMAFIGGTGAYGVPKCRSLSHEMGHWFNLAHTWGSTNNPGIGCGDDGITDTPLTKGEFGGCASSTIATCTQTNPAMAGLNNVGNIMNYADCDRNFTTGQTTAMRNALASTVSGRSSVSSATNLAFTDVNGTGLCNPIAEFYSTSCSYTVCQGASLSMKDYSYNGVNTGYQWAADNGAVVASPNASITSIAFPTIGTSNVSFTITNAQGTDVKSRAVTVVSSAIGFGPVSMESFENPGVPQDWSVQDVNNDGITWEQTSAAAYDANNSYMIAGASDPAGNSDILEMPTMDVLNNQSNTLEFAYAYRQSTSAQNDVLQIEGSRDCGGTWQTIYNMSANVMQNGSGGVSTDDFVPATNEWKVYAISSHPQWANFKNSSSVKVRFNFVEGTAGSGNNMYIDAVHFYNSNPVGINELTKSIRFNLYPNPTTGETNVNFHLDDPATIKVSVLDIMGREVLPATEGRYNAGDQTISVNKNGTLANGVYFVNLSYNGAKMSTKLVIN